MFIQLSKAVTEAHRRLFPDEPSRNSKTLQVIALALTALIPIYRRESVRELTEPELLAEKFTMEAMEDLIVAQIRFEAALKTMQLQSLDTARASLTLRQSPRVPSRGR